MHTLNFVSLKRCAQPYRSSLRATVANQHHRWARTAIEVPDGAKTMYENTSSISFYFATLQVNTKEHARHNATHA